MVEKNIKPEQVIEKEDKFKPGEKGFAVFLLLFGLYFFYGSINLYRNDPKPSSYGAVPLFVSAVIIIFSLAVIISDRKKKTETEKMNRKKMIGTTLSYIFPLDVLIIMILMVLYCIGLYVNIGFFIATPIFLWFSMCYLMRKNYLKNIIWTALSMVFILIIFTHIFKVVLP
ncbi:tripartite tricarboxylate transporter TctB family protein [Fusobacterium sp. PH5-44]|uniref:tripartite tricarboxylate transporter TctB family protein n=1 Tax=unclassified Fusobacterium TaxID=2648384 RepID=UPI003D211DF5